MNATKNFGWDGLRHGGLLLDPQRVARIADCVPSPLSPQLEQELRRQASGILEGSPDSADIPEFVNFVLKRVCGFSDETGTWQRGPQIGSSWTRRAVTGEAAKPRLLWRGREAGIMPVFIDSESRLGQGRGRRAVSQVHQWLRSGTERLAVLTNGKQWRLVFAGLDFDAWCEWDIDLWFEQGVLSAQVVALRTLLAPALWIPPSKDALAPLLQAVLDSRKGQAELSAVLGERVREAVEILVQAHSDVIKEKCSDVQPADIYRAAVRIVMRLVVSLFAESRDLLPRDVPLYHEGYGVAGLLEELEKTAARGGNRLARSWSAWPRVLALFRLIHSGSHHEAVTVPAYGGELFAPGDCEAADGLSRALAVFETACFELEREVMSDRNVYDLLTLLTRTQIKVRQGRAGTWITAAVDFSDFSSEYIGILYEGLLDFELKTAEEGDPVIFLALGQEPALPLSRLEKMDEKALAGLLEKMKNTRGNEEGESAGENGEASDEASEEEQVDAEEQGEEGEEPAVESSADISEPPSVESNDERRTVRTRAETWARKAVIAAKLVPKLRGALTPGKRLAHDQSIGRIAARLVSRVVLPGEHYLVRWGGTRKGAGTFYTRPGLAVPTVHRTLRPLAYNAPLGADGKPNFDAPPSAWTPKKPEEILALKVCDPACGSGTFPVATLRFLTEAVYEALHAHGRLAGDIGRSLDEILGLAASAETPESIRAFRLPCRPGDDDFEKKTKAVIRRYVVERSLYGVDIDPLAVELCRLSLWIETMDRTLPFSFLDHKIKCGNSLVGAWFDQFLHYPVMAWKNREGGDKNHTNGVHFVKEARTRAIKAFVKDRLVPDLNRFLSNFALFPEGFLEKAEEAHEEALAVLSRLHEFPIHETAERARVYRETYLGSEAYRSLKAAMDLWCACWFWPADELDKAPLPTAIFSPTPDTLAVAECIAREKRFFHWELEFPDVFRTADSGFDAMLGNPPWENLQPNPEEFFSNIDPLFRTYGRLIKQAAQREMFARDESLERNWLDYSAEFNSFAHWVSHSASPFGDPAGGIEDSATFPIGPGGNELHDHWREYRRKSVGYTSGAHPFRYQIGRMFTYKLFLELCYSTLIVGGRLGQIIPAGIYSDAWSEPLRRLFLDNCRWEWLFGFENREGIFQIHRSFKFGPIIIEKGGATEVIRTAFMHQKLEDWERAEEIAIDIKNSEISMLSPGNKTILEISSVKDLEILRRMAEVGIHLGQAGASSWELSYAIEFMSNIDATLFPPIPQWASTGYVPNEYGLWREPLGKVALPMLEGRMIGHFDACQKGWVSGKGRGSVWRDIEYPEKPIEPQYIISREGYLSSSKRVAGLKLHHMQVASATNARTAFAVPLLDSPSVESAPAICSLVQNRCLALASIINSFAFDFQVRLRCSGLHLNWHILAQSIIPPVRFSTAPWLLIPAARLSWGHIRYAAAWLIIFMDSKEKGSAWPAWRRLWAVSEAERLRIRSSLDALVAAIYGLNWNQMTWIFKECDLPSSRIISKDLISRNPKGFWRVDKQKDPELRHTILTLVAFYDLETKIRESYGDVEKGIETFLNQNNGEGWMLPETLRLADYGLGHDERSKNPQPVASRLGSRFYDWQLTQNTEESWRECHIHARNLLGERDYNKLLEDIDKGKLKAEYPLTGETGISPTKKVAEQQGPLFSLKRNKEPT